MANGQWPMANGQWKWQWQTGNGKWEMGNGPVRFRELMLCVAWICKDDKPTPASASVR
jgi:hypothetical protein